MVSSMANIPIPMASRQARVSSADSAAATGYVLCAPPPPAATSRAPPSRTYPA